MQPPSPWPSSLPCLLVLLVLTPLPSGLSAAAALRRCPVFDSAEALDVPPEIGYPVPMGRPRVIAAGARTLNLDVRFPCVPEDCPTAIFWQYKKDNTTKWKDGPYNYMYLDIGYLIATTKLSNLDPNSKYIVRACPMTRANLASPSVVPWCRSPNSTCFPESYIMTCEENPPPVEDLSGHSAGAHWLALSWTPPAPVCVTQLYYQVEAASARVSQPPLLLVPPPPPPPVASQVAFAGRFGSHDPQRPEGRVTPCAAWPGRHCLLLAATSLGEPLSPKCAYDVQVRVRREDDYVSTEQRIQGETRDDIAPSSPEGLHCTAVTPRNLTVRWLAPLRPGGRLASAVVSYQPQNESPASSVSLSQKIVLRADYNQQITNLQPNTRYTVTVWFVTATNDGRFVDGSRSIVEVWTPPDCSSEDEVVAARTEDVSEGVGEMWMWLAALVLTLVLLPIAFFLGNRNGRRKASVSNGKTIGNCNPKLKLTLDNGAATLPAKSAADTSSLYDSVQPNLPPCSTPPAHALVPPEYAEVQPAAQRAWFVPDADDPYSEVAGETKSPRQSYQSSHHYEILGAPMEEPQYAVSDSPYAEVLLASSNSQPPAVPSYLYAQVDKKKKRKRQAPSPAPTMNE